MREPLPPFARTGESPGEPRAKPWPLVFVIVGLLALLLVPLAVDRREAAIERDVAEVLEPARELALRLDLIHSRQIARFQSYLLNGDRTSLQRYREARAGEQALYDGLVALAEGMSLDVRSRLAEPYAVSSAWHVLHADALASDSARAAYLADLSGDQARNEELLQASNDLTGEILGGVEAARARMDQLRQIELLLTIALAGVALVAAALVGGIAHKLRTLVGETRVQREIAMRARREVDAILEATGDGVLGVDLLGRCTSLNPAGARLLGVAERALEGLDVHEALHGAAADGDGHERAGCPILRAIQAGRPVREPEDVLWAPDGTAIPVQWTVGPLMDGRSVKGAVVSFTDMREIRAAQEGLRHAVRARDEVVEVVSHDLRNPLGTSAAAAGLLLDIELPPEKHREHLSMIVRATEPMDRLIGDLLDVARIEGGGLAVEPAVVEVEPLLDEAVEMLAPLARGRGLELVCGVEPGVPAVRADRDRVLQVISNLVGNALKFTASGGIRLSARGDGERVVLAVSDTGRGLSSEALDHVFDRFWQQDPGNRQGAGLGLAIVRGIVHAHGGQVWVESRVGEGSTFSFSLPGAAADAEKGAAPASLRALATAPGP